ncbi:MAG: PBP1A family penicillin-binding protein [Ignavibacteriaceae bacterium]|nr:PBP1A family penicillin-binding protein [Ignavibacteriaceae bacterium]
MKMFSGIKKFYNSLTPKKKKIFQFSVGGLSVSVILFLAFMIHVIVGLPSIEELENPQTNLASKVYDINNNLIGQFFIEKRIEITKADIPENLEKALIATEDRKFYEHWGVDVDRIFKAIFKTIFLAKPQGASTITQQLAKNLYGLRLGSENFFETLTRKVREWISAIQIERNFTKDEILEMYLNTSFFGRRAYGVYSAADTYFEKNVKDLLPHESALLVGLLKSPYNFDPIRKKDNATARRNQVLMNMYDFGYLSKEDYEKYSKLPLDIKREKIIRETNEAPHFIEMVRKQAQEVAARQGKNLYTDGLNIYTTLDINMQRVANKAVADHLKGYQELFDKNWSWNNKEAIVANLVRNAINDLEEYREAANQTEKDNISKKYQNDKRFVDSVKKIAQTIETGFVVLEVGTGEIRALVGGQNQKFFYGLNHVSQIKRQPGSAFKPLVYAAAIENGLYPAFSLLNEKFSFKGWSPKNANGAYGGYMTLRTGLAASVNVVAARLMTEGYAPIYKVVDIAQKLGIKTELQPVYSLSLGTSEVSPLELANSYASIANQGIYVEPIIIKMVTDKNELLLEEFVPESKEAMSKEAAAITVNMMEDVINAGTGAGIRATFSRPAGGKTGTTQEYADAWFVGFTPTLCAAAWVGFDDRRVKFTGWYGQGSSAALPIWKNFFTDWYKESKEPIAYFNLPSTVTTATFCRESIERGDGRLAGPNCGAVISDIVNSKNLPIECDLVHRGLKGSESKKTTTNTHDGGSEW